MRFIFQLDDEAATPVAEYDDPTLGNEPPALTFTLTPDDADALHRALRIHPGRLPPQAFLRRSTTGYLIVNPDSPILLFPPPPPETPSEQRARAARARTLDLLTASAPPKPAR